jgi:hypothetical protein
MNKEFVPYEQALELKELGFDEPCFGYYKHEELLIEGKYKNSDHGFSISAPLYQQAFRWFREKYNAHIYPKKFTENTWRVSWGDWESLIFETYEEAELACLIKLIEIVKNK